MVAARMGRFRPSAHRRLARTRAIHERIRSRLDDGRNVFSRLMLVAHLFNRQLRRHPDGHRVSSARARRARARTFSGVVLLADGAFVRAMGRTGFAHRSVRVGVA